MSLFHFHLKHSASASRLLSVVRPQHSLVSVSSLNSSLNGRRRRIKTRIKVKPDDAYAHATLLTFVFWRLPSAVCLLSILLPLYFCHHTYALFTSLILQLAFFFCSNTSLHPIGASLPYVALSRSPQLHT